jgi:hypothetical protein
MTCPCTHPHDHTEETCPFDWPAIKAKERLAKAKGDRLSKCRRCVQPMWLEQVGYHHTCKEK